MKNRLELLASFLSDEKNEEAQKTLEEIIKQRKNIKKDQNVIDRSLTVYIAGPYTPYGASMHDAARKAHENTLTAINIGVDVIEKGHLVYIPHFSHFMHLYGKKALSYKYYTEADIEWLNMCDSILYYNHSIGASKGADNELRIAIQNGKRIFFSVDELPVYKKAADRYKN